MGRRRDAATLATWGGVLLLLAGATGSASLWILLLAIAAHFIPALAPIAYAAAVALALLASLGGLTVLFGAWLLKRGAVPAGKLVVSIGAGAGLLGFLFNLARAAFEGNGLTTILGGLLTLNGMGVALSVAATVRAR